MRALAIVLLVVNVLAFAWQYHGHVEMRTREVLAHRQAPKPAEGPPLQLLSELDELPPLKAPEAAPAPSAVKSDVRADVAAADACLDVGPFETAAARDAVATWLASYVASSHTRSEWLRTRRFFWVYLEPTDSKESARRNVAELAERGVKDYMLISRGDLENAISLGLFRSQDSVNRRLAELGEKGYKPVVVPRFETSERFFVSVQLAASATTVPELPPELLGEADAKPLPCADMQVGEVPAATVTPEPVVEGLTD